MIIKGFEHKLYFRLVCLGLPKGIEFVADDTARRKAYLKANPNFPNNLVLISCFTYSESALNNSKKSNKWINNYGGKFKDILYAMKIVRNAWTHNNGNISQNFDFKKMSGAQQYTFAKNILQSNATDKLCYDFDDATYTINVLPNGCGRISAICTSIFKNAGEIVVVEKKSK